MGLALDRAQVLDNILVAQVLRAGADQSQGRTLEIVDKYFSKVKETGM